MQTLTIREAIEADYPAVQAQYQGQLRNLSTSYPQQYRPQGAEIALKQQVFLDTLIDVDWSFFVAEINHQIVGVIQLSVDQDEDNEYRFGHRYVWIEELIVGEHPELKQIATQLIAAAEVWAKARSIKDIDFIVYDFNDRLREICAELGFNLVSTRVRKTL